MLFSEGVADAIIRKMTGHRSEELERYKPLSPAFKQQTVELIAGQLSEHLGVHFGIQPEEDAQTLEDYTEKWSPNSASSKDTGGADGTRTRDHRRDRQ
jgi:hypothetical protein